MFLDVRTAREYASGHVPGAKHVPWLRVLVRGLAAAPRHEEIVVYCELGPRAWMAKAALTLRGYRRVRLLPGHMSRWRRSGKPVE